MKLNPDCIRDVLLYLESELEVDLEKSNFKTVTLHKIKEHFKFEYSEEDIWYTVYNLREIHFITGRINDAGNNKMYFCEIENITWNGHQFLNNIRPKNVWDATKIGASKLGIMSVHALSAISMKIVEAIVTNQTVIEKIIKEIK